MDITVKVLAVIGVVSLLLIASCVGCAVMVYNAISDMPAHHSREAIAARYPELIRQVDAILAGQGPSGLSEAELPAGLLAVFREEPKQTGPPDYTPIHPAHLRVEKRSHSILNGGGSVAVSLDGQRYDAVAYILDAGDTSYLLALRDWQPEPAADAP